MQIIKLYLFFILGAIYLSNCYQALAQEKEIPSKYAFTKSIDLVLSYEGLEGTNFGMATKFHYTTGSPNAIWRPIEMINSMQVDLTNAATIYDIEKRYMIEVAPPQKYVASLYLLPSQEELDNYKKDILIEETTDYQEILGFLCQKIIYRGANETMEIWLNRDIDEPSYLHWLLSRGEKGFGAYLPQSQVPKGYPLKFIVRRKAEESEKEMALTFSVTAFNEQDDFEYDLEQIQILDDSVEDAVRPEPIVEAPEETPIDLPQRESTDTNYQTLTAKKNKLDLNLSYPDDWKIKTWKDKVLIYQGDHLAKITDFQMDQVPMLYDGLAMLISLENTSGNSKLTDRIKEIQQDIVNALPNTRLGPLTIRGLKGTPLAQASVFARQPKINMDNQYVLFLLDLRDKRVLVQVLKNKIGEDKYQYTSKVFRVLQYLAENN